MDLLEKAVSGGVGDRDWTARSERRNIMKIITIQSVWRDSTI